MIETATNTVSATVGVGLYPSSLAITPDGAFVYLAEEGSATVRVIATANNTVVATVDPPFAGHSRALAITPDGAFVYVVDEGGKVWVIATATNTVVATVAIAPGGDILVAVAITPDGAFAYVSNASDSKVVAIATATNTVVATIDLAPCAAYDLAITPDGAFVYAPGGAGGCNTVSVIATATNTVVATVPVGELPLGVAITPDGALAYVANSDPVNSATPSTVSVIATATNTVVATVGVGNVPFRLAITPDGAFVYLVNIFSNTVSVIAVATNTVVATVSVGENPYGVAITPPHVMHDQTISFSGLSDRTLGDPPVSISASASSGLAVRFTASGSCTVSGTSVTLTSVGTCSIMADQDGDANFNPAPTVAQSFAVLYNSQAGHKFLQPINLPPQSQSVFKIGSTIPVKLQLFLADGVTPASAAVATIQVNKVSNGIPSPVNETATSTVPNQGINFRYDPTSEQYIFNLGTKGWSTGNYQIAASLGDGSQIAVVVGAR